MDKCKYCTAPDSNCEYWCGTFCSYDLENMTNEDTIEAEYDHVK